MAATGWESLEIWSSALQRQGCPDTSARGADWIGTGEHAVVRTQKSDGTRRPWVGRVYTGVVVLVQAPRPAMWHVQVRTKWWSLPAAKPLGAVFKKKAARRSFQKKKPLGAGRAAARLLAAQITGRNEVPAAPNAPPDHHPPTRPPGHPCARAC